MKTLGKLKINSEKIINDNELQTLKGGDGPCCICYNAWDDVMGYMAAYDELSCQLYCSEAVSGWRGDWGNWTYC
jgi:natural product precursor